MKLRALLLLGSATALFVSSPLLVQAQERFPGCDSEEAHRFDFWTGEWDVRSRTSQPDGTWLETDQEWHAEEVVGGCVFIDFADGDFAGHRMRGMGTRYYVPADNQWVITWISTDNPGGWGVWRGGFNEAGVGDFLQETETPNGAVMSRIRWTDVTDRSARWEYGVSRDEGVTWTTLWTMEFTKQ